MHGPPTKIKIKTSKYCFTILPLCPLLPPNCCRLIKKIECKLFFNYWRPILINLPVCLPKYTVYYLFLFTIVAIATNVLATQTRQPPTRDSARASYENQNQNIKILLYYITTMSSATPQLPLLDQEDRMQIVLQLLEANPN